MKSVMEKLFEDYSKEKKYGESTSRIESEIEINKKLLKKSFNKKQKKLLLRIIDGKDLLKEESNLESFIGGLKIGLQVGYESNKG